MKAYEIPATITKDGKLKIPQNIMDKIPKKVTIKVILLIPENLSKDKDWEKETAIQFMNGYAESDAIYDKL